MPERGENSEPGYAGISANKTQCRGMVAVVAVKSMGANVEWYCRSRILASKLAVLSGFYYHSYGKDTSVPMLRINYIPRGWSKGVLRKN